MCKAVRIGIIAAGVAFLVLTGSIAFLVLIANDTITFTKQTQTITLPSGRILAIYRTSKAECYDCRFELRDASEEVVIPKTWFYTTPYLTAKSGTYESTPKMRTTFIPFVGTNSGVVGLASSRDEEILLVAIEPATSRFVVGEIRGPDSLSDSDKALGEQLLSALSEDYPEQRLALRGTESETQLRKHRYEATSQR